MANIFQQAGDMMKLRKQAMEMQKQLAKQTVTIEENGIKVVMSGDQKIIEFEVGGVSSQDAITALNKALRKSQEEAAKQMQQMGGLSEMMAQLSGK